MLRTFTRLLPLVALALTCTFAAATPAQALTAACPAIAYANPNNWRTDECGKPIPPTRLAPTTYKGWTYLNLNYCPPGFGCIQVVQESTSAWRWTGTRWVQASLDGGWVYVYPYTGAWRWAWTQKSGWVAISGHRFEIRSY